MENLKSELSRIADALELIAKGLQMNKGLSKVTPDVPITNDMSIEGNITCHTPWTFEEELFFRTAKIYFQETVRKDAENLKRKSGVKVSRDLIPMQINFMKKYLQGYDVYEHEGGVLVISKDEIPKALLRVYTDLGFHRGNSWAEDIKKISAYANNLNVDLENIFVIVLSNNNGLDNSHVFNTLNQNISNKDILAPNNLQTLRRYCTSYVNDFKGILPNPHDQIFFLAGNLHPNVIAQDIYENPDVIVNLSSYPWISTPLSTIISIIRSL